jgi:NhaA family Na+:H+ antiporter
MASLARKPLERFLHIQAASGILLLFAAAVALAWANSPWRPGYARLWHTPLGIRIGSFAFERTLEWFVNDALMVIFFFVVGMEIRRELHRGELSEWRRAALPAAAAAGGMLVPAGIYLALAGEPTTRPGWGVPMATDIAFAVGILTLLGRRVPPALRVLLLALAVIDDLGAIVVIALCYSSGVVGSGLLIAALGLAGILAMQRLGVRAKLAYVLPAFIAWAGTYTAGIHPTIAGVIVGLMTPVRAWLGTDGFVERVRETIDHLAEAPPETLSAHELATRLGHVDRARREAMAPSDSLIEALHPWVAFGVMPIFALANAGVSLSGSTLDSSSVKVALGAALGLAVGKPIGVLVASWLTLKSKLGTLPRGLGPKHLLVLGVVAGIGFTMALFVAQLAFSEPHLLSAAKVGVLASSGLAGVVALVLGRWLLEPGEAVGCAETADEAEGSTEL